MSHVSSKVDGFLELLQANKQTPAVKGETLDAHFAKTHAMAITAFELNSEEGKAAAMKMMAAEQEGEDIDQSRITAQQAKAKEESLKKKGGRRFSLSFEISKDVDAASPLLFMHYCERAFNKSKAQPIPFARVTLRKSGGPNPLNYLVLEFSDVHVASYALDAAGSELPGEKIAFTFKSCTLLYTPQSAAGGARRGTAQSASVDFSKA